MSVEAGGRSLLEIQQRGCKLVLFTDWAAPIDMAERDVNVFKGWKVKIVSIAPDPGDGPCKSYLGKIQNIRQEHDAARWHKRS
jgi:hypothetical protein